MQSQVDGKKLADCDPGGREGIPSLSMWQAFIQRSLKRNFTLFKVEGQLALKIPIQFQMSLLYAAVCDAAALYGGIAMCQRNLKLNPVDLPSL